MAEKLSIQIALEGGKQVEQQLASLGDAGAEAFKQISKAAKDVGGFDNLETKEVEQRLENLGVTGEEAFDKIKAAATEAEKFDALIATTEALETGLAKLSEAGKKTQEAFQGITLEGVKTSAEITKIGLEAGKTGLEIYQLTQKSEGFFKTLLGLASSVSTTARAFGLLEAAVGTTAVVVGGVALALGATVLALEAVRAAATAAAAPYEKLNHELQTLAQTSDVSFAALQTGVAGFEQIGVAAETARQGVVKLEEAIKEFDAGKIAESGRKVLESQKAMLEAQVALERASGVTGLSDAAIQLYNLNLVLTDAIVERQKAEEAAAKATDTHAKASANSLKGVIDLIKQIEQGQKGVEFNELTTADTKIAALTGRLQEIKKGGGDVNKEFVGIIKNATSLKDALAFGKLAGFSETDVDRIRRYGVEGAKIDDLYKRLAQTGPVIGASASKSFDEMRDSIQRVDSAWARLDQALQSTIFAQLGAEVSSIFSNMKAAVIEFAAAAVEQFNSLVFKIIEGWKIIGFQVIEGWKIIGNTIAQFVTTAPANAWQWVVSTFDAAVAALQQKFEETKAAIIQFVTEAPANAWQWIVDTFNNAMKALGEAINAQIAKLKELLGLGAQVGGGAGGDNPVTAPQGFARGGSIGGRGTGTSDSNLAWVSRGEHIMPARAVRQPGVLAFLEALRRSGGNLRHVLDGMGRFALGGPVTMPALAGSGIGSMSNVTIQFPGLQPIGGLRASADVVEELRKAAAMAQVRSGGRKPSRYS